MWKSPLTSVESLRLPRALFDSVAVGLMKNLFSLDAQRLRLLGIDLSHLAYRNVVTSMLTYVLRSALTQLKSAVDPVLDAATTAFTPLAEALDHVPAQIGAGPTIARHASTSAVPSGASPTLTIDPADLVGAHSKTVPTATAGEVPSTGIGFVDPPPSVATTTPSDDPSAAMNSFSDRFD